jgi:hypothetical protein
MSHMPTYGEDGSGCSSEGSCAAPRVVEYTATGAEVPAGVTIPIGATLSAATYHVGFFGLGGDGTGDVPWAWGFPNASRTTSQFLATFTGTTLTAGAVYKFQIIEAE